MKTKILRQRRFVVSGGMALVFAGLIPAANSEPPKDAAPSATPPPAPSPATTAAEAAEVASAIPTVTAPSTPPTDSYPAYDPQAVNYFYDSLAPYGSWVDVAGYGWCWQPTVSVVDVSWRPYSH